MWSKFGKKCFNQFFAPGILFRVGNEKVPSDFSCAIVKRRKTFSTYLMTYLYYSLRTFKQKKKNCRVRSGQVNWWGAGFVTPPQKSLQSRQLEFSRSDFLSSGLHNSTSMCYLYISLFFYFYDLRLGKKPWSIHYKPIGNIEIRPASSKLVKTIQFFPDYDILSDLWWRRCH